MKTDRDWEWVELHEPTDDAVEAKGDQWEEPWDEEADMESKFEANMRMFVNKRRRDNNTQEVLEGQ